MATVTQLIANAEANIAQAEANANAFLQQVLDLTNVQFPGLTIPTAYNYQTVPVVDLPINFALERPDISLPGLGVAPPAPTIDISALQPIVVPNDDLLVPTHEFEYFEQAYQSTLLDPLKTKLLNDLLNGGTGIEPADEAALVQRARNRETELALSGMDAVGRSAAGRGFPLSPEERALHQARAHQDMQSKTSSLERDIYVDRASRSVENRRFILAQVKEIENVLIGFHQSVQERALNVARAAAEFAIAIYNTLVTRVRTRLEQAKIKGEVQVARFQAEAARAQALLGVFQGQISVYEANLRRQVEGARLGVELYRADTDGNKSFHDTLIAKTSLQQKVIEATRQQNLQVDNLTIENAKAKLLATIEALRLKAAGRRYATDKSFGLLTALVSTINSLAVVSSTEE